ncbi:DinB family protein [Heyndrickxia oleronia]|uniref:DinB family protein n=1 Tax=Heyndrickxia oleronia TaxID=38875 RepID=A0AAW6T410_9BACI|nr:DinB family protein [Heyndrickxia oleronia]MDH5162996.1 DinB family protein [Heyndrickxia oleronia]
MAINLETLFLIDQKDGMSLEFSKLVSMMNYARETTIAEVQELNVEELDFLYGAEANSIGMLLAHMVSVEKAYQIETFYNREVTDEEINELNPALELGSKAREQIHGNTIDFYMKELIDARNKTIETFQTLPDEWLFQQTPFWFDQQANNYFKWFHVFEDEINHRGQIRIIKKMMANRLKV